jgi:hypothetical protein
MISDTKINEEMMLSLADTMAAAAASFSSHGYDQFILAREQFVQANRIIFSDMQKLRDVHSSGPA